MQQIKERPTTLLRTQTPEPALSYNNSAAHSHSHCYTTCGFKQAQTEYRQVR